jgi:hypothetical protein
MPLFMTFSRPTLNCRYLCRSRFAALDLPLSLPLSIAAIFPLTNPAFMYQPLAVIGSGQKIAEGLVPAPVEPVGIVSACISIYLTTKSQALSQRELHMLHAEILALQKTLGISYKDAAHRLYMSEVERIKKADSATKSFAALGKKMDELVNEEICPPIQALDNGQFDDYIWINGVWKKKDGLVGKSGSGSGSK